MNLLFWGMTTALLGKILIAVSVIKAHTELAHEHRVDARVIRSFHVERAMTIAGVVLLLVGYVLEVLFFGGFSTLFWCEGGECMAALGVQLAE